MKNQSFKLKLGEHTLRCTVVTASVLNASVTTETYDAGSIIVWITRCERLTVVIASVNKGDVQLSSRRTYRWRLSMPRTMRAIDDALSVLHRRLVLERERLLRSCLSIARIEATLTSGTPLLSSLPLVLDDE